MNVAIPSIDAYINQYPPQVQTLLHQMRKTIRAAAPQAQEAIKYGLPTFVLHGNLVHFGGFKEHIGFYPAPSGIQAFKKELSKYEQSKGAIRFPLKPLPTALITKIVKYRVKQNLEKIAREAKPARALPTIHPEILAYSKTFTKSDREICSLLAKNITQNLPAAENKIWHRHPVWFLDGNPIAGYSKLKDSVRLLFWSGQSFDEPGLMPEGSFKAAEIRFTNPDQIHLKDLKRWLNKAKKIQWDYKNIVKRKGKLIRLA